MRALMSPTQRTFEHVDVSTRTSGSALWRRLSRFLTGDMTFSAVRLLPSESVHVGVSRAVQSFTDAKSSYWQKLSWKMSYSDSSTRPADPPLLWGLTLGVLADLFGKFPGFNALDFWEYPSFTALDVRFVVWVYSYHFCKRRRDDFLHGHAEAPTSIESARKAEQDQSQSRSRPRAKVTASSKAAVAAHVFMYEGYDELFKRAVPLALGGRGILVAFVLSVLWRRWLRRWKM